MNLVKSKIILTLICVFVCGSAWAQDLQLADFNEVQSWIERYDQTQSDEVKGHLYGVEALEELMAQPGVTQVKIFNAIDADGTRKLVFKGLGIDQQEVGLAYDISKVCPPFCGGGGLTQPIPEIGSSIELAEAQLMVSNFSVANPEAVISYTYPSNVINTILQSNQAAGIYLAYGIDTNDQPQLILMGLGAEGNLLEGKVGINPQINYNSNLSAMK